MTNLFFAPTMTATSTAMMANGLSAGVDLITPKIDSFHYEGPMDPTATFARNELETLAGGGLAGRPGCWGLLSRLNPFARRVPQLPGPKAGSMHRQDRKKLEQVYEQSRLS